MLTFVCIICSLLASILYGLAREPGGAPAIAAIVAGYLFNASISLWVSADAMRRGTSVPYDFDSFVFFTWPITAPVYLLRTRGARGCGVIILFLLFLLISVLFELAFAPREILHQRP
jgi:phosphotransferase system  glucose/maltose/N-acetylglucosamine-specific IIC component